MKKTRVYNTCKFRFFSITIHNSLRPGKFIINIKYNYHYDYGFSISNHMNHFVTLPSTMDIFTSFVFTNEFSFHKNWIHCCVELSKYAMEFLSRNEWIDSLFESFGIFLVNRSNLPYRLSTFCSFLLHFVDFTDFFIR